MRSLQRSFQVSDAGQTGKLLRFVVYQESAAEGAVQGQVKSLDRPWQCHAPGQFYIDVGAFQNY